MDVLLIVVGVLVIALLLYLGNRARGRRRIAAERQHEKLTAEAEDHRTIAADHEAKAEELREAAGTEDERAARHQDRAAEVDPETETKGSQRE